MAIDGATGRVISGIHDVTLLKGGMYVGDC